MKIKELRGRSNDELARRLVEHKKELMALRFQKVAGQLTDTAKIREIRRTVARIKTLICENLKAS